MIDATEDSIQARLARRAQEAPDSRGLAMVDRDGEFDWTSFGDLYEAAHARARELHDRGVRPGDTCVLAVRNDEFGATSLLGVLRLGAVPVMAAPPVVRGLHSNLEDVLEFVVQKTGARALITAQEFEELGRRLRAWSGPTELIFGPDGFAGSGYSDGGPETLPGPEAIGAMQLTSGTTGFPRVCVWKQRSMLAALDGMTKAMDLRGGEDCCVNWTPLYHDMGLVNNFLLCLTAGVPLVLIDPLDFIRDPGLWLRILSESGATITWSPNFGFAVAAERVPEHELEGVDLSTVRAFWNAAERIHLETIEAFHHRFAPYGVRLESLKTNFGLAENVGGATFSDPRGRFPVERLDAAAFHEERIARPADPDADETETVTVVGVGRPYPGMSIEILSAEGEPLPDGHIGEIALLTPSRMEGYLKHPEATARAFHGDRLRTGDLGYLRGDELFWVGRLRERINIHGQKYDPSDFEGVLLGIDGLREGAFAAFGVDDPEQGTQQLVIVAERRDDNRRSSNQIIREICSEVSARFGLAVGDVLLLPRGTMSKTSSGKRRHTHYRKLYMRSQLEPVARLKQP